MRLKYDSEDSRAFKCCFCCHVRLGTILLGLFHLIAFLVSICYITTVTTHNLELLQDGKEPGSTMDTDGIVVLKEDGMDKENDGLFIEYDSPTANTVIKRTKENMCLLVVLHLCYMLIVGMLVYGAVRSRPSYLMPFFCLQVFDFCLTCLWIVGYMTYAPDIKEWMVQQHIVSDFPAMKHVVEIDERWLMLWFVIVFALVISWKAYMINMVWACYKYLQLRNANKNVVREYTVEGDGELLLPPKYEEAMKMEPAGPPPPPYTA